jgi:hypothetical protein
MTCSSSGEHFQWAEQVPISFTNWKSILSKLTNEETTKRLFLRYYSFLNNLHCYILK